ncbi:MAG: hypothetical protein KF812_10785 [Fimbriimonadaceae bacterium]|nr:hypothetical protein [Fimbriimonadaceae bacterium]
MFRRKPSIRRVLILTVSAIIMTTLVVIGFVAFFSGRQTVGDLSQRIVRSTVKQVDDRVASLLNSAQTQGRLGARLANSEGLTRDRLAGLGVKIMDVMAANPQFSAMTVVNDSTGDYVSVVQRPNGALVIQVSTVTETGRTREDLVPFGSEFRTIYESQNWDFDPRQLFSYQGCKKQERLNWGSTDLLRATVDAKSIGVTCAVPLNEYGPGFTGAVLVDLSVADLSNYISKIRVAENGYAFLIEKRTSDTIVVAHPDRGRLLTTVDGVDRLATMTEVGDPVIERTVSGLLQESIGTPNEVRSTVFTENNRRWLVGMQTVSYNVGPVWAIGVAVPEEDFMSGVRQTVNFVALIGAGAVLVALTAVMFFARRISSPLVALAKETERIREFDFSQTEPRTAGIREVDQLAQGFSQMKIGLRSFEKMVPGEYARSLLRSGEEARIGGERKHISTSFADLVGFTSLSERLAPEELVGVLAEYLDLLSEEVLRRGGTVDKFNGDDVMAFWGAPNPVPNVARMACENALASRQAVLEKHPEWAAADKPALRVSFGIGTGDVIVGNIGSRRRMHYTVIGDAVNLASRLQGLNKAYLTEILIDEVTARECGEDFVTRRIDYVAVAGREEATAIFELVGWRAALTEEEIEDVAVYQEALGSYRIRKFDHTVELLVPLNEKYPQDGPIRILLTRARTLVDAPPPKEWDGVTRFTVK